MNLQFLYKIVKLIVKISEQSTCTSSESQSIPEIAYQLEIHKLGLDVSANDHNSHFVKVNRFAHILVGPAMEVI